MPYLHAGTASKEKTIKKYKPKMATMLKSQNDRIVDRYAEYFNLKSDDFPLYDVDVLIDYILPGIEDGIIKTETVPMHTSGIQKGVEDINDIASVAVDSGLGNIAVAQSLNTIGNQITKINTSTKVFLRRIILKGVADGDGVLAISDKIKDAGVNEYYKGRALAIARTETRKAYDEGGRIAYKDLGVEKFDVVGCVGTSNGNNFLGQSAGYGSRDENIGCCGLLKVDMKHWSDVSQSHHINHNGTMTATEIPLDE